MSMTIVLLMCPNIIGVYVFVGVYCYGSHLVVTVDIMGVIVKKDVRDKIILYAGTNAIFLLLVIVNSRQVV